MVEVLSKQLLHNSMQTRVATLRWVYHLLIQTPHSMFGHVDELFPLLLKTLSDPSDEVSVRSRSLLTVKATCNDQGCVATSDSCYSHVDVSGVYRLCCWTWRFLPSCRRAVLARSGRPRSSRQPSLSSRWPPCCRAAPVSTPTSSSSWSACCSCSAPTASCWRTAARSSYGESAGCSCSAPTASCWRTAARSSYGESAGCSCSAPTASLNLKLPCIAAACTSAYESELDTWPVISQAAVHSAERRRHLPLLRRDSAARAGHQVRVVHDPDSQPHSPHVNRALRVEESA